MREGFERELIIEKMSNVLSVGRKPGGIPALQNVEISFDLLGNK